MQKQTVIFIPYSELVARDAIFEFLKEHIDLFSFGDCAHSLVKASALRPVIQGLAVCDESRISTVFDTAGIQDDDLIDLET